LPGTRRKTKYEILDTSSHRTMSVALVGGPTLRGNTAAEEPATLAPAVATVAPGA
jgi:hypothetical protein